MAKHITKSLVTKLAEACNAVGGVDKKGRNEFQRYNYVKAADIAKAIRHELFERGIIVVLDEKEWTMVRMIKTNSGNDMPEMLLKCEVTFRDGVDVLGPFGAFATAMDSGDKAIYKAKTGCLKYVLRQIGLIPDERDDPEADESVDEQTDERVLTPAEKKAGKKRKTVAEFKVRAFDAACHTNGKTASQVAEFLRARFSAAAVHELTDEDFGGAIKWAMGTEELAATIATSVTAVTRKAPQPIVNEFDQRIEDEVAAVGD